MPNQHRYPNLNISGVSPELRQAVQGLAAARGESVSAVVRRALGEYVAEQTGRWAGGTPTPGVVTLHCSICGDEVTIPTNERGEFPATTHDCQTGEWAVGA